MSSRRAIGLMSGTSHDGVDVALIDTDGEAIAGFGPTYYRPYDANERALLRGAITAAADLVDRGQRPEPLGEAELLITRAHAEAVEAFLDINRLAAGAISVVGFHGQTVLHRPQRRLTVQLGDGPALAARLGIPVVYDFRAADVAAGGQGAPLVPVFHRALVRRLDRQHPVCVLNLGGVANLTYVDHEAELIACDSGPGNALIDDFLHQRTGQVCDQDGLAAAAGRVDEAAVARVLAHAFFARPAPKSLDRNEFHAWVAEQAGLARLSLEDGAATLTAVTAATVAAAFAILPRAPVSVIAAGGGTRNATLMRMLAQRLAPAKLEAADQVGWSTDALEAQAFGYLAVRKLKGLPATFPGTTGVLAAMPSGFLAIP
jgi:anhydro-N-acetylmuramic acid kinase